MSHISELRVYERAYEFSNEIWKICTNWDYFSKKTIGEQMVRSSDSISANLAEGYGRYNVRDNMRFCFYSRGSLEETKDWLNKAHVRALISGQLYSGLNGKIELISKDLWNYIQSLKKMVDKC